MAWERVRDDIETEQANLAQASGSDFRALKDLAKGATGVPAEFVALENDLGEVLEKLGTQEVNVRTRLIEAYRVLAFPKGGSTDDDDLFTSSPGGPLLECYRVTLAKHRTTRRGDGGTSVAPLLKAPSCSVSGRIISSSPTSPLRRPASLPRTSCAARRYGSRESVVWRQRRCGIASVASQNCPCCSSPPTCCPPSGPVTATPDALWTYYDQREKKVYTRDNAAALSPVLTADHFLYDLQAAVEERILPVTMVSPQEVWEYLWPRDGTEWSPTVAAVRFIEAAKASPHFPVLPERSVLRQALQEGAREHRWVLYLRGPNLAIGAQEMHEWPGTPRFDEATELWTYQAALDEHLYPRHTDEGIAEDIALTPRTCATAAGPGARRRCPQKTWNALRVVSGRLEPSPPGGGAPGRGAQWDMGSMEAGSDETFSPR